MMNRLCSKSMLFAGILFLAVACQQPVRDGGGTETSAVADTVPDMDVWFEKGDWLGNVKLKPDPSIDRALFYKYYHNNQELWDKAFAYMATMNPDTIQVGQYPLEGEDLFVKVTEYDTVDPSMKDLETHGKYTDIQFVLKGTENIGVGDRDELTVTTPYSEAEDIGFYEQKDGSSLLAEPGTFFIFFPENAHAMGIDVDGKSRSVKKAVIKVRDKADSVL